VANGHSAGVTTWPVASCATDVDGVVSVISVRFFGRLLRSFAAAMSPKCSLRCAVQCSLFTLNFVVWVSELVASSAARLDRDNALAAL